MSGLKEYAAKHGSIEPPVISGPAVDFEQMQEDHDRLATMKRDILLQLEQGEDPESILYTAIHAIGLATHDKAYTEQATSYLNGNKAEASLFLDLDEMEAKRAERRRAYLDKRRKDVLRQVKLLDADRQALRQELDSL